MFISHLVNFLFIPYGALLFLYFDTIIFFFLFFNKL